uniref:Uncharacterized protein n=1 Tax=Parascaris univalens TaxID=6257 RepID=A0A915A6H2_PARUN
AGLFGSAVIVIRVVAVMFVSIYAIVICRKRRTNDFIPTTTISLRGTAVVAASTQDQHLRQTTKNERDSLNFIRAAQKLLANEEIVASEPNEVKAEKTITVTYRATEEDDDSDKSAKTESYAITGFLPGGASWNSLTNQSQKLVRSKRTAGRTSTGTKGIIESLEERTQKSDLKVPKAEVANTNQDATVDGMLMTTAKNNALKLSEDKTPAAVPPEPPESEDCQRAMLMRWFGAPACSATPKAKRKEETSPHDDDTQRSHVAFSNRKQKKKTRTSVVNRDSKFESLRITF